MTNNLPLCLFQPTPTSSAPIEESSSSVPIETNSTSSTSIYESQSSAPAEPKTTAEPLPSSTMDTNPFVNSTTIAESSASATTKRPPPSAITSSASVAPVANATEIESSSVPVASSSSKTNDIWVPTETALIMPAASTTTVNVEPSSSAAPSTTSEESSTSASTSAPVVVVAPLPANLPSAIVPASTEDGDSAHVDDQLVNLLFSTSLPWSFVANNSEATAQIMLYTPKMLESALALNDSACSTVMIKAYQPASLNGAATESLTLWVGYVPTDVVPDLQAQIKAYPSSALYNQTGIPGELALQVDRSYPVLSNAAVATSSNSGANSASSSGGSSNGGGLSDRDKDILIGVTVSVGGTLWLVLVVWVYRRMRRNAKADIHRRMSMNPTLTGRNLATVQLMTEPPMMERGHGDHARSSSIEIDGRPSSFYAFSPPSLNDTRSSSRAARNTDVRSSHTGTTTSGGGASNRISALYRAFGGYANNPPSTGGTEGSTALSQQQQASRRRGAGPTTTAAISAPRNFQHVLDNPINPFANPTSYKHTAPQVKQYGGGGGGYHARQPSAGGNPFGDEHATASNRVYQRRPVNAQDISGPVLRESSLGF